MGLYVEALAHENPYLQRLEKSPIGWLQSKLFEFFFLVLYPVRFVWFKFALVLANVLSWVVLILGGLQTLDWTVRNIMPIFSEPLAKVLLEYSVVFTEYMPYMYVGIFFSTYAITILQLAPFEETDSRSRTAEPSHSWISYIVFPIIFYISIQPSKWFGVTVLTVAPVAIVSYLYIHFTVLEQFKIDYKNTNFPYYKAEWWLIGINGLFYSGLLLLYLTPSQTYGYYLTGLGLSLSIPYRVYRNHIVKKPDSGSVTMSDHYQRKTPTSSEMNEYIQEQIHNRTVDNDSVDGESYHNVLLGETTKGEWIDEYTASEDAITKAETHNKQLLEDIEYAWDEFSDEAYKKSEAPELQTEVSEFREQHIMALKEIVLETLDENEEIAYHSEQAAKRLLQVLNRSLKNWKEPSDFEEE